MTEPQVKESVRRAFTFFQMLLLIFLTISTLLYSNFGSGLGYSMGPFYAIPKGVGSRVSKPRALNPSPSRTDPTVNHLFSVKIKLEVYKSNFDASSS